MNYDCPICNSVIVGSNFCPLCRVTSTIVSQSTVTIEDVTDEEDGRENLKRRRDRSLSPSGRGDKSRQSETGSVPLATPSSASSSSYALAHTLGRCRFDPHGGDGAYSKWMQEYFSEHLDPRGCVYVDRLQYDGPVGNIKDGKLGQQLNPVIIREFTRFLKDERVNGTRTIVLNWHLRFTGTPNGWTGRGVNPKLIAALKKMAESAGKKLVVIYTVHEYSDLSGLPGPNALVALNPDVHKRLGADFDKVTSKCSRVPNLMTSLHTSSVDLIMRHVGEPDHGPSASNLMSGCLLQHLRLLNGYSTDVTLRTTSGIVIFGMITQRHGTTLANVVSLCKALTMAGFSDTFKVIVVGKTQEPKLEKDLREMALTIPRLVFHGLLDSFDSLVGCKYAISFDPLGFRHNASAMVNVTRAGHLLFSRRGSESDEELVMRAAKVIWMCEKNPYLHIELLAAQQPRFRSTSAQLVGHDLDLYFRQVAATASSTEKSEQKS